VEGGIESHWDVIAQRYLWDVGDREGRKRNREVKVNIMLAKDLNGTGSRRLRSLRGSGNVFI